MDIPGVYPTSLQGDSSLTLQFLRCNFDHDRKGRYQDPAAERLGARPNPWFALHHGKGGALIDTGARSWPGGSGRAHNKDFEAGRNQVDWRGKLTYNCVLTDEDGSLTVEFPDLSNVITYGHTDEEALRMAEEALNGALASDVARGILPGEASFAGGHSVTVDPHIAIAIQLRRLRGKRSQAEIAARLGITYQAYQKLENPITGNPTLKTLEKAARAFDKRLELTLS